MGSWLQTALGEGWLGKSVGVCITAIVSAALAWFGGRKMARSRVESIATATATEAVKSAFAMLQAQCDRAEASCKKLSDDHATCEHRLDALEREKRLLRQRVDRLMRQRPVAPAVIRNPKPLKDAP